MTHFEECLNKYTAIYRCADDIINLKIRIKFRENSDKWDERVFTWQEKIFSRFEQDFYRDEENCVTDLDKKYHLACSKISQKSDASECIDLYSYVNDDDFTVSREENVNFIEESDEEEQFDFKKSVIAAVQNAASYNNKRKFYAMLIMADFGEYVDTTWIKYEKVLVTLKFFPKTKVLTIFPDFTKNEPYLLAANGSNRNCWFCIENISEAISEEEHFREREILAKITSHKIALQKHLQDDASFNLPSKKKLSVYLFFEILIGKNFEHSDIYVQYYIDLPEIWFCGDSQNLHGVTQICRTKDEEGVAHFGHVFDVILDYNLEDLQKSGIPKSPYIYFEVVSKSSFDRYRTEGLTYRNIPLGKPGNYSFELQCVRLISNNVSGQLRRFFIGDFQNYDDVTWIGVPKDNNNLALNKYGTATVGTGQLGFKVNVVHQSQAFLGGTPQRTREIFDRLNSSSLVKSVEQVLAAFKRARNNMIEARLKV